MIAFALKADCLLLVIYIVQIEKIERKKYIKEKRSLKKTQTEKRRIKALNDVRNYDNGLTILLS